MKKLNKYLTPLLTVLSLSLYGQKDSLSRFQLGVSMMPDVNVSLWSNDKSIPKLGGTFGISVTYRLYRNLSVVTGLNYAGRNYESIDYQSYSYPRDPTFLNTRKKSSEQYLELPVKLSYIMGIKKLRFTGSAGLITDYFLQYDAEYIHIYDDREEKSTYLSRFTDKRFSFSPFVSLGLDYRISDKLNLRAEPTFRFFEYTNEPDIKLYALRYNAGVNFGIYYCFKN
jgi:hypothetical protein